MAATGANHSLAATMGRAFLCKSQGGGESGESGSGSVKGCREATSWTREDVLMFTTQLLPCLSGDTEAVAVASTASTPFTGNGILGIGPALMSGKTVGEWGQKECFFP